MPWELVASILRGIRLDPREKSQLMALNKANGELGCRARIKNILMLLPPKELDTVMYVLQ